MKMFMYELGASRLIVDQSLHITWPLTVDQGVREQTQNETIDAGKFSCLSSHGVLDCRGAPPQVIEQVASPVMLFATRVVLQQTEPAVRR
jgi:hypothetical protein